MIINVCGWGQEPGRKGGDRKWDSQGDGKREKQEKTRQQHAIFCNRKSANRQEPAKTGLKAGGLSPLHPPPHMFVAMQKCFQILKCKAPY